MEFKNILNQYYEATGQNIDYDKSRMFLRKWINHKHKKLLISILKVGHMSNKEKYLGSPILLTNSRMNDFSFLEDSLKNKMKTCKSNLLAQVGGF